MENTEQNSPPLVSIIINNYNYARFLADAINSALNQTYASIEVIVVDDGSTDNSREIISDYGKQIVPVLKENGGQASAFNAGFAASTGDIICILDADDLFMPEKVAQIVNVFEKYQDISWCFHRLRYTDAKTGALLQLSYETGSRLCDFRADIKKGRLPFKPPATSGLCFKRPLLQQILPMPEIIAITSDNYLKFIAAALSKGYFLDEQLAILRVHGNNRYTGRTNNQNLKANIAILTAYCMRTNWPVLAKLANNHFCDGLGIARKVENIEAETIQNIQKYLSIVSTVERLEISLRSLYRSTKLITHKKYS